MAEQTPNSETPNTGESMTEQNTEQTTTETTEGTDTDQTQSTDSGNQFAVGDTSIDFDDAKDGEVFTKEQMNAIFKKRIARFNDQRAQEIAAERTDVVSEQVSELQTNLQNIQAERDALQAKYDILNASQQYGISAETLERSKLTGDELTAFAESLKAERDKWTQSHTQSTNAIDNLIGGRTKTETESTGWAKSIIQQVANGGNE